MSEDILEEMDEAATTASGRRYLSIPQRLARYRIALTNAAEVPEIGSALALFGYSPERLAEGAELLAVAEAAQAARLREQGEQYGATDGVEGAREILQGLYGVHLPVARIALAGDRGAREALGLVGSRSNSHPVYAHQAEIFYTNLLANEAWMTALAAFGQTEENLIAGKDATAELQQALAAQKKETGEAQEATVRRDLAFSALESWMADFYAIARLAITNSPQQLEMLGIFVRS